MYEEHEGPCLAAQRGPSASAPVTREFGRKISRRCARAGRSERCSSGARVVIAADTVRRRQLLCFTVARCCACQRARSRSWPCTAPSGRELCRPAGHTGRAFPAGGPTDVIARIFAERLRQALGQAAIVENVAGAGRPSALRGLSGPRLTATRSPPAIRPAMSAGLRFIPSRDILNDLEPVTFLSVSPTLLVASKDFPANTVQELIVWLKANPGKATGGGQVRAARASSPASCFRARPALGSRAFPSRRSPCDAGLVGGQIDLRFAAEGSQSLPYLRDGQIKALAVSHPPAGRRRPTCRPSTRPACRASPVVVERHLGAQGSPARRRHEAQRRHPFRARRHRGEAAAARARPGCPIVQQQTPQALAAYRKSEIDKWWPIMKADEHQGPSEARRPLVVKADVSRLRLV